MNLISNYLEQARPTIRNVLNRANGIFNMPLGGERDAATGMYKLPWTAAAMGIPGAPASQMGAIAARPFMAASTLGGLSTLPSALGFNGAPTAAPPIQAQAGGTVPMAPNQRVADAFTSLPAAGPLASADASAVPAPMPAPRPAPEAQGFYGGSPETNPLLRPTGFPARRGGVPEDNTTLSKFLKGLVQDLNGIYDAMGPGNPMGNPFVGAGPRVGPFPMR